MEIPLNTALIILWFLDRAYESIAFNTATTSWLFCSVYVDDPDNISEDEAIRATTEMTSVLTATIAGEPMP